MLLRCQLLRCCQRRRWIFAGCKAHMEARHETGRNAVVDRPEAGDDARCTGEKKCTNQADLLAAGRDLRNCRLACAQHHRRGLEAERLDPLHCGRAIVQEQGGEARVVDAEARMTGQMQDVRIRSSRCQVLPRCRFADERGSIFE